ncbi:conserved hypothetical protein [Methanosalsum zhilinae DSM 4017]|uniref:Chromosome segregation ATPase n=1 Tax=Methanosalsum zhilinae (strain DSM 4017 / NBRC 107636 / OCM 62 / WeN5) TaxID=679901 RepID=F7XMD9_METZD|nr:hypothetical protein [Methanosalsum zhilinae]AEH61685.1 conserved hypothetical protein [Methanosalsum zhilinae DSM 4017]
MIFTYQDSTELPVQRDFIQDLQELVNVCRTAIPLEKSAINIKHDRDQSRSESDKKAEELENLKNEIVGYITDISGHGDYEEISKVKKEIVDSCESITSREIETLQEEIEKIEKTARNDIDALESRILSILSPFFADYIYNTHKRYRASMKDGFLQGTVIGKSNGMEYTLEVTFAQDVLTVEDLCGELSLPTLKKSGIIHKEDKLKMMEVSDFTLFSARYEPEHIDAIFEDKDGEQKFRVTSDDGRYVVYFDDNDITEDSRLSGSLDMNNIEILVQELKIYLQEYVKSNKLTQIMLDGEDALASNRIFDCLRIIARQYGEIVRECLERAYVKNEISIKIQQADDTRTEKYITKEELYNQLSDIGEQGRELAEILHVSDPEIKTID